MCGLVPDINVPAYLRDYFSKMPPIFKNAEVGRQDKGEFMQNWAERHRVLTQPRKTLIGSYIGQNMLLATPLLQWYLFHGLEVLGVQQVVEYRPQRRFQQFGETVFHARRQGDWNPSKASLSDTFKLLGNSACGKTTITIAMYTRPPSPLPCTPMCFTPMREGSKHWSMTLCSQSSPLPPTAHPRRKMYTRWRGLNQMESVSP